MLKAKGTTRPDKELSKTLISLVYAVIAMVICLLFLFVFPEYSLFLLIMTLVISIFSIGLTINVLNASEEALTYGGFANELLNSPDIINRIDNNKGCPIIENETAQKFFNGEDVMECLRTHLFDERQNLLDFQRLELALKSLKREHVTLNLIFDNNEEWYDVSVRPLYLKKSDIFEEEFSLKKIYKETYFYWKIKNVTASKNMEKIFEEERKKLHSFINRMPVGIYIADSSFKLEYVNETFASQLYAERDVLTGKQFDSLVVKNEKLLNSQLPEYSGMAFFRNEKNKNMEMFVEQRSFLDGADIKICGMTINNLPNDNRLNDDLNFLSDELEGLINLSPYGIIIISDTGKVVRVNHRAREITDIYEGEPEKLTLESFFEAPTVSLLKDMLQSAVELKSEKLVGKLEARLKSDKLIRIYIAPRWHVHQKDGVLEGLTLYLEDATEQKNLEIRFAQAQKMQAMGQLAGGIAHDFNNLLTAMIGFCDLLLQRHGIGDPSFADLIQIKQNANRAAGLVRQLLAFSRKQPLKPKHINVTENFIELSHLMKRILGEQITLDFNHGHDLGYIKVDPVQFSQVIINLAVNAKDAMNGRGCLTISTHTEKLTEPYQFGADVIASGEFVVINVTDTGCGIPAENLSRIFEPFFSTKQNVVGSGTGLGLAMVYGIVRQTEGFIRVDSVVGKGTTFSIYLPRFEKAEEATDDIVPNNVTPAVSTVGALDPKSKAQKLILGLNVATIDHNHETFQNPQDVRILFVEDEDSVRTFGVRALKKKGFTVISCNSAENAVELLNLGEKFNLLITDMVMPGMSGADLAQEIKKRLPDIKIILASGYSEEIARRELKGNDEFEFIAKPYSLGDLTKKVLQILGQQEAV